MANLFKRARETYGKAKSTAVKYQGEYKGWSKRNRKTIRGIQKFGANLGASTGTGGSVHRHHRHIKAPRVAAYSNARSVGGVAMVPRGTNVIVVGGHGGYPTTRRRKRRYQGGGDFTDSLL